MTPHEVVIHAALQSAFDWSGFLGGVISGAGSTIVAFLALRSDRKKDKIAEKIDRLDVVQETLLIITDGIEKLSDKYNSGEIESMADAIRLFNEAFMLRLQKVMPKFAGSGDELLQFFITLWENSIDERDRYARAIQENNPGQLWDPATKGIAGQTILGEMQVLGNSFRELSEIQKRLIEEMRPKNMKRGAEYENIRL